MKNKVLVQVIVVCIMHSFLNLNAQTDSCFQGRPIYHFAPPENWTNDPNGLVYVDGIYHLFYQHNPFGMNWGHMSWGHATSKDLLHWQHLPVAIPEDSVMIFSGSTVCDSLNTSGLGDEDGCLVAIYTAHRNGLQTQHIAYSNDLGNTWVKYHGNPVLNRNVADFRDPKVFWYAPHRKWIMVIVLPVEFKVLFYSSPNLINWTLMSEFGPQGYAKNGGVWECPDFIEMPVNNPGITKWVLLVSYFNPHEEHIAMQYFIGEFDGSTFVNDNSADEILWLDYGKDFYAGITYNNTPINRRIFIAWMDNWMYAEESPEKQFRGRMTVPRILALNQTINGLRVFQKPVIKECKGVFSIKNCAVNEINSRFAELDDLNSFSLKLSLNATCELFLAGAESAFFKFNKENQEIVISRNHELNCFSNKIYASRDTIILNQIESHNDVFELYFDSNSLEVFYNNGQQSLSYLMFPGIVANKLVMRSKSKIKCILLTKIE